MRILVTGQRTPRAVREQGAEGHLGDHVGGRAQVEDRPVAEVDAGPPQGGRRTAHLQHR